MPYAAAAGSPTSTCVQQNAVAVPSAGVQIAGVNPQRVALTVVNTGAVTVFVGYGFTPTAANYSDVIAATATWKMPVQWQGSVSLATASTASTANSSEFS